MKYKNCRIYDLEMTKRWYDGRLIYVYAEDSDVITEDNAIFVVMLSKEDCEKYGFPRAMCVSAQYIHANFLNSTEDREILSDLRSNRIPSIFSKEDEC